jgi:hypothetical protein
MEDQLALYLLDQATLERAAAMDFIEGSETAAFLERKGQFLAELFLDGGAGAGALLGPLGVITGTPLQALVGKGGEPLGPTGPYTFCTRIPADDLELQLRGLSLAQRALGQANAADPQVAERARRLVALAQDTGLGPALARELQQIERFLETGRGARGAIIAVYSRW